MIKEQTAGQVLAHSVEQTASTVNTMEYTLSFLSGILLILFCVYTADLLQKVK
jgi:hypothetical protein